MEEIRKNNRGFPPNAIRLCIEQWGDAVQGRAYSRLSATPLKFENCFELLLRTDKLFDRCGYPQSFSDKKDFKGNKVTGRYTPPQTLMEEGEILRQQGELYTLDIFVRSRRNAGWQGIVTYQDGSPPEEFFSEMELLECIGKCKTRKPILNIEKTI